MTRSSLADLRAKYAHVVARIERTKDRDEAWREAKRLSLLIEDLRSDTARLRERLAARMADERSLTLRELAEHLSVTKSLAGRMVRAGAPTREDTPDVPDDDRTTGSVHPLR